MPLRGCQRYSRVGIRHSTDFYIHEHGLLIEVEGKSYFRQQAQAYYDHRTAILESLVLRVVHFPNEHVSYLFSSVYIQIQAILFLPEKAPLPGELSRRD